MKHGWQLLLLLIASVAVLPQSALAQNRDSDRDSGIARAAYESGYADGYSRGYRDHGRRGDLDYRCSDYDRADRFSRPADQAWVTLIHETDCRTGLEKSWLNRGTFSRRAL
jgi:hypothetical protein